MAGGLIVLEGIEGVGKSTQLQHLRSFSRGARLAATHLREPGGTPAGDEIRRLLLDPASQLDERTEALLFMASRAQLVADVIRPALNQGEFVLLDRFFLSTYAYQIARDAACRKTRSACQRTRDGRLIPDLTLLLDLPPDAALARAASEAHTTASSDRGLSSTTASARPSSPSRRRIGSEVIRKQGRSS